MPVQVVIGVDKDLIDNYFYEPVDGELFVLDNSTKLEDLAVLANIFPSKNQARKNGWSGELSVGIHCKSTKKNWVWWWKAPENIKDNIDEASTDAR